LLEEMNRENLQKKMADGKIQEHVKQDETVVIGGGKKKQAKNKKKVEYEDIFSLDVVII